MSCQAAGILYNIISLCFRNSQARDFHETEEQILNFKVLQVLAARSGRDSASESRVRVPGIRVDERKYILLIERRRKLGMHIIYRRF